LSTASGHTSSKGDSLDPWASLHWKDEFGREAYQTIKRGVDDNIGVDNIALELKTLRMANNADMDRVRIMVVAFFLKQMPVVEGNTAKQREAAKQVFGKWGSLITALCQGEMATSLLRLQVCREKFPKNGLTRYCIDPMCSNRLFSCFWKHRVNMVPRGYGRRGHYRGVAFLAGFPRD
jgi:hypothetical protein